MGESNDLSISFASDLDIQHITDEPFLLQSDLYTDLDQLERSVEAEFELYLNQARSFPFNQDHNGNSVESDHDGKTNSRPLRDTHDRSISPGQYFGARSLPLNSMSTMWLQQQQQDLLSSDVDQEEKQEREEEEEHEEEEEEEEEHEEEELYEEYDQEPLEEEEEDLLQHSFSFHASNEPKTEIDQLLALRFKSLPKSLHASFVVRKPTYTPPPVIIEKKPCILDPPPPSPLYLQCEITNETIYVKLIHLKLTNPNPDQSSLFSLFSAEQILDFEQNKEGTLAPQETREIKIKVKTTAIQEHCYNQSEPSSLSDKLLVLIDTDQAYQYPLYIDFTSNCTVSPPGRPPCRYCALEQGYPLYSLPS